MQGKRNLILIGRISLVATIVGIIWLFLPLRIADPEQNQVVSLFTILGVLIGLGVASAILPRPVWVRVVSGSIWIVLSTLYVLALIVSMVGGGPLVGYETLDSVVLGHSTVKAYRTNGGATTDYGILISQEMAISPGIVLVRVLHSGDHESKAALRVVRPGVVSAKINDSKEIEYRVKTFVYFE